MQRAHLKCSVPQTPIGAPDAEQQRSPVPGMLRGLTGQVVEPHGVHPQHAEHALHVPIRQAVVLPQDLQRQSGPTGVQGLRRAETFSAGHHLTQQGCLMTCRGLSAEHGRMERSFSPSDRRGWSVRTCMGSCPSMTGHNMRPDG